MRHLVFWLVLTMIFMAKGAFGIDGLVFEKSLISVSVKPGENFVKAEFSFQNKSSETVFVRDIKESCDCTTAELSDDKDEFASNDSGKVVVVMETGNFSGTIDKDIIVRTNKGDYQLTVRAIIPEIIRMTPRRLEWMQGDALTSKEIRISLPKDYPLNLCTVELNGEGFDYEPVTIKRGREYQIIVTPKQTSKPVFNTIWVTTDSKLPRYQRKTGFLVIQKGK